MTDAEAVARIAWQDPTTQTQREYVLCEGATVSIGRSASNDICIPEEHVSRQHAVIAYRNGIFMLTDLGSSNGTYINDDMVTAPFPLFAGDTIRLYTSELRFFAIEDEESVTRAKETGRLIMPDLADETATLTIANGPQEGHVITLLLPDLRIGRATTSADWEILLQDPSVSRPHARLYRNTEGWHLVDLNSSNGTSINDEPLAADSPALLHNGDTLKLGNTILLFRRGWHAQNNDENGKYPTNPTTD